MSALLAEGPQALARISDAMNRRLSTMGYRTVAEARGALSLDNAPDSKAWERLNYARLLQGWR